MIGKTRLPMALKIRSLSPLLATMAAVAVLPISLAAPLQREARVEPAPAATAKAPETEKAQTGKIETAKVEKPKKLRFQNSIVALVDGTPITSYELEQRIALVMSTSNIPRTPEMEKKVREQVLDQLVTESLQRTEANKNDITVSSVEIDKYVQNILDDNHMELNQLKEILAKGGVQFATFRSQLAASLQWQKAVQDHFQGRVTIAPEAVDAEMARIKEGENKAHYAVSEIFLAVDNPDQDEKVKKDAINLANQLKSGGQFASIARQFSQSASAAQGGDIGTVYDGQLAAELNTTLRGMKSGDVSEPVRSIGGYYILALRQRFEPENAVIEEKKPAQTAMPASLPLSRILLRMPPKPAKEYVAGVMDIAKKIQAVTQSCEWAKDNIVKNVPGALYFPLGMTRLADLNADAQAALAKTESGMVADPYLSDAGIEILVRCDPREVKKVKWQSPTREQIENQLFNEQISALARRYARDLRRNATIETR